MTYEINAAWEDLTVAILSVNQQSLEKTYSVIEGIRRESLCEPAKLAGWTINEIASRLKRAGYDRGDFMTHLFAERLAALGKHVESVGIGSCEKVFASRSAIEIAHLLRSVKGIGPKVLANFFVLQDIGSADSRTGEK
jgi:hypothetical protein